MTNLTEQYQKGELPVGAYYVKYYNDSISPSIDIYRRRYSLKKESELKFTINQIEEVLAEVPSYDEWQQMKKWCEEFHSLPMVIENTKLKELLKEVQSKIRYSSPRGIETFADLDDTLLGKINQILGDKTDEPQS